MPDDPSFTPDWLAMREPLDHAVRPLALLPLLKIAWRARQWSRVLDLASGTGSNLRYLAPRLPGDQDWTLVDHDADLLARVEVPSDVRTITKVCGDVATQGTAAVADAHLVTASAFLDLASDTWLRDLATACRSAGSGVLFALTYDGSIEWNDDPPTQSDPVDRLVRDLVNAHQQRDKGLGPALGPKAGAAAESRFREAGYRTWFLPSPWRLNRTHVDLVRLLVDGWQRAAIEQDPQQADVVRAWGVRRRAQIDKGTFSVTVGHVDMLALPTEIV